MFGVDALVARADIGVGEQRQDLVRARAADDPVGIEAVARRDRLAQRVADAVRDRARDGRPAAIGLDRLRRRAERRLVRGQLVDLGHARRRALAGHIGVDVKTPGAGLGTGCRTLAWMTLMAILGRERL